MNWLKAHFVIFITAALITLWSLSCVVSPAFVHDSDLLLSIEYTEGSDGVIALSLIHARIIEIRSWGHVDR